MGYNGKIALSFCISVPLFFQCIYLGKQAVGNMNWSKEWTIVLVCLCVIAIMNLFMLNNKIVLDHRGIIMVYMNLKTYDTSTH